MPNESGPLAGENAFFAALLDGSAQDLDHILAEDFVLIDVMNGSEIPKSALVGAVRDGQLKFEQIDRIEFRERRYGATSVVTGRTRMSGKFGDDSFAASSRYTHVYVEQGGWWRLVAAQGTRIGEP
jgi:hypothetical protein